MALTPVQEQPTALLRTERRLAVVLVIRPRRLLRVVEEILGARPNLQVVGRFGEVSRLASRLGRLRPQLVVASVRSLGREHAAISTQIRRSSPGSKLILIHPVPVFPCEAHGAQLHLTEDVLVHGLIPAVARLAGEADEQVALTDSWGTA
jgi:hypothetical protein